MSEIFRTHVTILSGDLQQNDGASFYNYEDNSFHVVTVQNQGSVVLDGFTMEGGNADQAAYPDNLEVVCSASVVP